MAERKTFYANVLLIIFKFCIRQCSHFEVQWVDTLKKVNKTWNQLLKNEVTIINKINTLKGEIKKSLPVELVDKTWSQLLDHFFPGTQTNGDNAFTAFLKKMHVFYILGNAINPTEDKTSFEYAKDYMAELGSFIMVYPFVYSIVERTTGSGPYFIPPSSRKYREVPSSELKEKYQSLIKRYKDTETMIPIFRDCQKLAKEEINYVSLYHHNLHHEAFGPYIMRKPICEIVIKTETALALLNKKEPDMSINVNDIVLLRRCRIGRNMTINFTDDNDELAFPSLTFK